MLDVPETDDPDALAAALERHGLTRTVLIPCTDEWSQVVAQLCATQPDAYLTSAPAADVVELLVDKLLFAETVERLDVPHPWTHAVDSVEELETLDLDGAFLKPRHSQLFARRYHQKAFTFEGIDEAREKLRLMAEVPVGGVLQFYVPGPSTSHYFIDGFVDRDGRVAALFARRRVRMFPLDFGNSTLMVSVPLAEVDGAVTSLKRLLTGIGYRGVFSAEYKRDANDGLFKILEVNARPWWYVEFAAYCGVDVSYLAYLDALGRDVPAVESYKVGERCVLLPQDVRAFLALRRAGELALLPWLRSWLRARSTVFEWSDPLPALSLPIVLVRRKRRHARQS